MKQISFIKSDFTCFKGGIFALLFFSFDSSAQLGAGDIAVIGCNRFASNFELTIVSLVDIPANTTIFISDYGWQNSSSSFITTTNVSEGVITWEPTVLVSKGSVFLIKIVSGTSATVSGLPGNTFISGWSSSSASIPVSIAGDNWFIFQGLNSTSPSQFIFGWTNYVSLLIPGANANGWLSNGNMTSSLVTTSELPSQLTNGTNSVSLAGTSPTGSHGDNNAYYGIQSSTKAQILSEICNYTKWNFDEVNTFKQTSASLGVQNLNGNPYFTTFNIIASNTSPTDISLSSISLNENVAANTTVGNLSSTDADAGNTFTYTLVSGIGSTDNASFNISGNSLRITNSPDFESASSYSVRVRTTDQGGLTFEKAFAISINNVVELANIITQPVADSKCEGLTATFSVTATNVNSYQWQESTNGVNFSNISEVGIYSGTSSSTLMLTGVSTALNSHKFRCVLTNFDGSINTNEVLLTVVSIPIADSPSNVSVCDSYTLPALTVGNYFTGSNGTGTAFTAGDAITTSQTLYVYATNGICSNENSFDVTITSTPSVTSTLSAARCDAGTLTIEATPSAGTINWFAAATGGSSLYAGTNFTTPSLTATTPYYAEVANGSCVNATREAVVANIGGCTQIRAIQCGATVSGVNESVFANQITGATNYKFEITDPSSNVFVIENVNRSFQFSQFAFTNNTTYHVRVAAKVGGVYAPYGSSCDVRFEYQSKIQSSQCGATITNKLSQVSASAVSGATAYKFEITDPSNNITYIENSSRTFTFAQFAFVNNTTYNVRVSAKTGSVYAGYGATCAVRIEQTTKIQASQCGIQIATPTTTVWSGTVTGATGYRFELTDQNNNVTVLDNPTRTFKFNQFAYISGGTYSVRVSVKTGSYYAVYGAACNVTAPGTIAPRPQDIVEMKSMSEPTFDFEAFPNPSNGDFTISSSEVGTFNILNELGQLVRTVEITEANGNQVKVENMPNGAYFVTGMLNGEAVTKKVFVVR